MNSVGLRGPKSVSEMLITDGPNGVVVSRPDAPYTLTDLEADQWRSIVSAMPADYFAATHFPLLSQLCRHIVAANCIGALLAVQYKSKKIDQPQFTSLLSMQAAESSSINRLMRSMRLTHQALYRADSTKPRPATMLEAPWHRQPWDRKADKAKS